MAYILIHGELLDIPDMFTPDTQIGSNAVWLNRLFRERLGEHLTLALTQNPKANISDLSIAFKATYATCPPNSFDPVHAEAISIAKEWLTSELAKQNLPPPMNFEIHASELAASSPDIQSRALKRVQARLQVGAQTKEELGL